MCKEDNKFLYNGNDLTVWFNRDNNNHTWTAKIMSSYYFKLSVFSLKKKNELNTIVPLKTTVTVGAWLTNILTSVDNRVIEIIKAGRAGRSSENNEFTSG